MGIIISIKRKGGLCADIAFAVDNFAFPGAVEKRVDQISSYSVIIGDMGSVIAVVNAG